MRRGVALLGLLLAACAGGGSAAAPTARRGVPPGEVTPAFQAMRSALAEGARDLDAGNLAALRARRPEIVATGISLLRSSLPHDLQRALVPRFLEGRAAFGEALKEWTTAAEGADDGALRDSFQRLFHAFWGWLDAYKGLPPERSV